MSFASLTPELLEKIFVLLFFKSFDRYELIFPSFHAPYLLIPTLRVCKSWNSAAERILYSAIYLGSGSEDAAALKKLCDLLEKNTRLSFLVREVHFTTYLTKAEARNQVKLLRLCPKIQALQICGWNGYFLTDFHNAIKQLRFLEHLRLARYTFRDMECDAFASFDTLLDIVQQTSSLKILIFDDRHPGGVDGLIWERGHEEEEPVNSYWWDEEGLSRDDPLYDQRIELMKEDSKQRLERIPLRFSILYPRVNSAPELRVFKWQSWWEYMHVRTFSLIAPNLEEINSLRFSLNKLGREEVERALERWGSSLRSLVLFPSVPGENLDMMLFTDALASKMTSLRRLEVNTNAFAWKSRSDYNLETLKSFPVLEELVFHASADEQVRALQAAIPRLPGLKQVELGYTEAAATEEGSQLGREKKKYSQEAMNALKEVCEKHGVQMKEKDPRRDFDQILEEERQKFRRDRALGLWEDEDEDEDEWEFEGSDHEYSDQLYSDEDSD